MKFIQANIYGFGKWVDQTIEFPTVQPICFYGENESGKTTIQQFILYVLFGLPPRKIAQHQPVNSNKIGGMLVVQDNELGQYKIERVDQKVICYTPSGELEDEQWLQSRLQGINREVFMSIYAFSALDLTEIKQMKKTELSDVLFSVGLTGSTNIYEAEKKLDTKINRLFKKQGRKPIMNEQIKQTKASHTKLMETQRKEAVYEKKRAEINQLKTKKTQQVAEETRIQSSLVKEEKVLTLLPQLHQYERYDQQLRVLPSDLKFPENGLERLDKVKGKLLPLKSEIQVLEKRLQQDQTEKQTNEKALYDPEIMDHMKAIVDQKARYEHLLEQQKSATIQLEQTKEQLIDKEQSIQIRAETVENTSLPFHLEKQWEELARTEQQLLQEGEKQTSTHEALQKQESQYIHEKQKITEKLLTSEEIEQLQVDTEQFNPSQQPNPQGQKWRIWEERRMKTAKGILIGASVIAIIALIFAFSQESYVLLTIPFVIVIAAVMQYLHMKRTIAFFLEEPTINGTNVSTVTLEAYEEKQHIVRMQLSFQEEIATIDKQLEQLALERTYWKKQQTEFLKKEHLWIQQMEKERHLYPFLQDADVRYWTDLLAVVRELKRIAAEQHQGESALQDITNQLQAIEAQRIDVSRMLDIDNTILTFQQLQEMIQKQETTMHFITQYEHQIIEQEKLLDSLKQKQIVYEEEMHVLFRYAHVQSEESYVQIAKQIDKKSEIETAMSHTKQQLTWMFSEEEMATLLSKTKNEHDVKLMIRTLEEELKQNKSKQEEVDKQIATLELEIDQLELSNDHSSAIYQHQIEIDTLQQFAKEWSILKIAQSTLAKAKMTYQENHLAEVLDHTSRFFRQITGGRYVQVLPPSANETFQVEGNDHIRYTIDKLSQGTVDQLYIALRLAISVVMSHRYNMPLLIDDAFVHFDERRTKEMLDILTQLGNEQQVIVFTCKQSIANANQLQTIRLTEVAEKSLGGIQ